MGRQNGDSVSEDLLLLQPEVAATLVAEAATREGQVQPERLRCGLLNLRLRRKPRRLVGLPDPPLHIGSDPRDEEATVTAFLPQPIHFEPGEVPVVESEG